MLYHLGILMVRLRWVVIAVWAGLFLGSALLAPRVTSSLSAAFGSPDTEARRALDLIAEQMGTGEASITIAFHSDAQTVQDPSYATTVREALVPFASTPMVTGIITYFDSHNPHMVSADGKTTYAVLLLKGTVDDALEFVSTAREQIKASDLDVHVTGGVSIFYDINELSEHDLRRAEMVAFPLVLSALLIVFASVVAAGLPVAVGALSVVITLALIYLLTLVTPMSIFVLNIATFLGLGLAVDYSLLVVTRFREELAHRPVAEAVGVTVNTAGRAILFSALTSIIGLSGLLLFDFMMLRSLGIGGVLVVATSMLIALTLLPAVLGVLGPRVNFLSLARQMPQRTGMWHRLATVVMRHPIPFIAVLVPGLLFLGAPFLRVNLTAPWADILPSEADSRQGWDLLSEEMGPGALSPITVTVQSDGPVLAPQQVTALYNLVQPLTADPRVARVESIVTLDPSLGLRDYQQMYADASQIPYPAVRQALDELTREDFTMVRVFSRYEPMAPETRNLVQDIRAAGRESNLSVMATGITADLMDSTRVMYRDFPLAILYVVVVIYVVLLALFRSLVLPLKAVIMNTLSILASYGALVVIFQQGFLSGLLGFTSRGTLEPTVPIILFAILFGLSMDYEVFLLTRVKEEYDHTGDNTGSVAMGMERTGRVITSAALILVLVSGAFATADIMVVKALGVGTAIAIFLDASIVRALLVPALMRVLGRWNWWAPRFLKGKRPTPLPSTPGNPLR